MSNPINNINLSIITPVYNEEENVEIFYNEVLKVLNELSDLNIEIIFCLDPSTDNTESLLRKICQLDTRFSLIKMSRKFGQPACTIAGIENCRGDYCVIVDFDMQDPLNMIPKMYKKITSENYDVVNAKRTSREGLNFFYKTISFIGYRIIQKFSEVEIPKDVGDFRIINRKVIEHLKKLNEKHNYLRGLISFLGFRQGEIKFDRIDRKKGKSKYNSFFGSLKIAVNGLICYSNFFLNFIFWLGLVFISLSIILILIIVFSVYFFKNFPYPIGFATLITLSLFFGGIQLLSLGIVSQYIGRIYEETKNRPKYIIDYTINLN